NSVYTPLIDRNGLPYVYGASPDIGVVIFNISNQMSPVPVDTIGIAALNNEKADAETQVGNNLYIASGNIQAGGERAGLTIYDVTSPAASVAHDHWDSAAFTHGCSQVIISGNYAYLAAMDDGIIILNISNRDNIQFVSHLGMTTTSCLNNNHARG